MWASAALMSRPMAAIDDRRWPVDRGGRGALAPGAFIWLCGDDQEMAVLPAE